MQISSSSKSNSKNNIYLYGPPGAGKTSVAKLLGKFLNMPTYDVDDDHLETFWGTTVSQKLSELGDEGFVQAEAEATMKIDKEKTIISLTGSNPLHDVAMNFIRSQGVVVFLDVSKEEILKRLDKMKVCRVVGQASKSMSEILDYRTKIYEKYYDTRVIIGREESLDSIAQKVITYLNRNQLFYSTRGDGYEKGFTFTDVITMGLAKDQGLFLPHFFPFFNPNEWERFLEYNFEQTALRIIENFPISPISSQRLKELIEEAYSTFTKKEILPIKKLNETIYIMEEYYGPTASFKDLALQLFARIFQEINKNKTTCVLVATSGDTGSAVLSGFSEKTNKNHNSNTYNNNTPVIVLYPYKNVSQVQERQMLVAEGNVAVIGVKGDFDFCQGTVKKIFQDNEFISNIKNNLNVDFTSANSINWGRLLPQIIYSIYSYMELVRKGVINFNENIDVCIPSGNFGNILAVFIAKKMGLPIDKLICASNENNILAEFLNTGVFSHKSRNLLNTISPAIDILNPSNLERLLSLLMISKDGQQIKQWYENDLKINSEFKIDEPTHNIIKKTFFAEFCSQNEVKETIRNEFKQNGILIDPHTAVGKTVIDKYLKINCNNKNKILLAATAHYAKFPEAILNALDLDESGNLKEKFERLEALKGKFPEFHRDLKGVLEKKIIHEKVADANYSEIKCCILECLKEMAKK